MKYRWLIGALTLILFTTPLAATSLCGNCLPGHCGIEGEGMTASSPPEKDGRHPAVKPAMETESPCHQAAPAEEAPQSCPGPAIALSSECCGMTAAPAPEVSAGPTTLSASTLLALEPAGPVTGLALPGHGTLRRPHPPPHLAPSPLHVLNSVWLL